MASPQSSLKRKRATPPTSRPSTPELKSTQTMAQGHATPASRSSATLDDVSHTPTIPTNLTQVLVNASPSLQRLQQDLLILTSFNETETLHWRPSWFKQHQHAKRFWTLYNPPNVVTELLPRTSRSRLVYTRRMRRAGDGEPAYVKDWAHWARYCALRGVPTDFLCEGQVELMRLGLPRNAQGEICAPPVYPLFPEPQPLSTGRFLLTASLYASHLPLQFHGIKTSGAEDEIQVVVVHSTGALKVEQRETFFQHASQWTHFDGAGGYTDDWDVVGEFGAPKDQGRGRRWSYLPWTGEMEGGCRNEGGEGERAREEGIEMIKMRLKNDAERSASAVSGGGGSSSGGSGKKRKR